MSATAPLPDPLPASSYDARHGAIEHSIYRRTIAGASPIGGAKILYLSPEILRGASKLAGRPNFQRVPQGDAAPGRPTGPARVGAPPGGAAPGARGGREVDPNAPRARRPLGISFPLWTLLAVSLGFFLTVQLHARVLPRTASVNAQSVPVLQVDGPATGFSAGQLWLRWDAATGADRYLLHISTSAGETIVDPLPVYGTVWNPPDELLPALDRGQYEWYVEAVDAEGALLARSTPATFSVAH